MAIFSVTVRRNGHRDFDWEKFLLSNAPTLAVWVHDLKIDSPGCPTARSCRSSACEQCWPRSGRALCARCWRAAGTCIERSSPARSRGCARLQQACSNRNAPSLPGFGRRVAVGVNEDFQDMGSSTFHLCKRRRVQSVSKWGSSQSSIKTWVFLLVGC